MLIDVVIGGIETYLEGHKSRSLRTLERRSGVSYSTIRRIMQREVTDPSIEKTVIPLLGSFLPLEEVYKRISPYSPSWATFWKPLKVSNFEFQNVEDIQFHDIDHLILALSRKEEGTSFAEVEGYYGKTLGGERLRYLLEKGILKDVNQRIVASITNVKMKNPKEILQRIESSARNFDIKHVGRGSYIDYFSGTMSETDYQKVKQAAKALVDTIHEVIENPSKGEEKVVFLSLLGDFIEGSQL